MLFKHKKKQHNTDGKNDNEDDFVVRTVTAVAADTITVDKAFADTINAGVEVLKVSRIDIGSKEDQAFFSAKIAGKAVNGEPIVILIPKMRIVQGFNIGFSSDDYANMPFEFTLYDQVPADPYYAFSKGAMAHLVRV